MTGEDRVPDSPRELVEGGQAPYSLMRPRGRLASGTAVAVLALSLPIALGGIVFAVSAAEHHRWGALASFAAVTIAVLWIAVVGLIGHSAGRQSLRRRWRS